MSSTYTSNAMEQPTTFVSGQPTQYISTTTVTQKPVTVLGPGATQAVMSVPTQPVTNLAVYTVNDHKSRFGVFTWIMSVLSAVCWFIGAVLNIAAMSCQLSDATFYYNSVFVLLIIGFSFWFAAVVLNAIPSIGGYTRSHRSGYLIAHSFYAVFAAVAMILFITGAGCFLSNRISTNIGGNVVWIIAGSLWLAGVFIRDLGLRYDMMNTYKNYPLTKDANTAVLNANNGQSKLGRTTQFKLHMASIWANSVVTTFYFVVATLFLIGAIMYNAARNGAGVNYQPFGVAFGVMWLVASIMIFFGSFFQCVARR